VASGTLAAGLLVLMTALAAVGAGEPLVRANVSSNGAQANSTTSVLALSGNGRYLAFVSRADNLAAGAEPYRANTYVRDLQSNTTTLEDWTYTDEIPNGDSKEVAISSDGRILVFTSDAANQVPAGGNSRFQLYARDRQTKRITRLSQTTTGGAANASVERPAVGGTGRFVVFDSAAGNLVTADTQHMSQVYLVDRNTGQLECVSVTPAGLPGNGDSREAFVSADGRYVAFHSFASDLTTDDTDNQGDIFIRDRQAGTTRQVTISLFGAGINSASHCTDLSPDGSRVVFTVPAGASGQNFDQVFYWDANLAAPAILSHAPNAQLNGPSGGGKLSSNGRVGTYVSLATNVVDDDPAADGNGVTDVFVVELQTNGPGINRLVSRTPANRPGGLVSDSSSLSADGKRVAFLSDAFNLVANDTNNVRDAFVRDRSTETLVSTPIYEIRSTGPSQLLVRWIDRNTTETGYEVQVAAGDGPYAVAATTGANVSSQQVGGLTSNTRYRCRIRAVSNTDVAPHSQPETIYTLPNAPRNVRAELAEPRTSRVRITWEPGEGGAAEFEVRRAVPGGSITIGGTLGNVFTIIDENAVLGANNSYVLYARNADLNRSVLSEKAYALVPPAAPVISSVDTLDGTVTLNWHPVPGATTYRLKRSNSRTGPFTLIGDNITGTRFTDLSAPGNRQAFYRLSALNSAGEGPDGDPYPVQTPPARPVNLRATVEYERIHLTWQAPPGGAESYRLFRAERSGGPYESRFGIINETAISDTSAFATTYFYVVQAKCSLGYSVYSNEISVTTTPAAPTNLSATPGSGKITLSWTAVHGATGYRLRRNLSGSTAITTIGGNLTTARYVDSGLGGGKTYQYRVVAYSGAGESRTSALAQATTLPVLTSLTLKPTAVKGGKKATATVTLDSSAPAAGTAVLITSDNPTLVKLPASVRVPSGKTSIKFQFSTRKLTKKQKATSVQITAKLDEKTVIATLWVKK
jgi:hypothetical protein